VSLSPQQRAAITRRKNREAREAQDLEDDRIIEALGDLFNAYHRDISGSGDRWEIGSAQNTDVNLATLLAVCKVFRCKPEQLFCHLDSERTGCASCGWGGNPSLQFEVRR